VDKTYGTSAYLPTTRKFYKIPQQAPYKLMSSDTGLVWVTEDIDLLVNPSETNIERSTITRIFANNGAIYGATKKDIWLLDATSNTFNMVFEHTWSSTFATHVVYPLSSTAFVLCDSYFKDKLILVVNGAQQGEYSLSTKGWELKSFAYQHTGQVYLTFYNTDMTLTILEITETGIRKYNTASSDFNSPSSLTPYEYLPCILAGNFISHRGSLYKTSYADSQNPTLVKYDAITVVDTVIDKIYLHSKLASYEAFTATFRNGFNWSTYIVTYNSATSGLNVISRLTDVGNNAFEFAGDVPETIGCTYSESIGSSGKILYNATDIPGNLIVI
jgi:hypothetical protein